MVFPPNDEASELVEQGEGLLDDLAQLAQPFHAPGAAVGDDRDDAAPGEFATQPVAVIAGVREQGVQAASHRGDAVDQVQGRADVVCLFSFRPACRDRMIMLRV